MRENGKQIADLTVAISTLDRPEAVGKCLEALLSAGVLPAEIIVIDQSSDDRTMCVVSQHTSRAVVITYIHHDGRGLASAQNFAFACARHPVVAVTDDDCVPAIDWVARIEAAFSPSGQVDVLTGRILSLGPETPGKYAVSSRTSLERVDFDRKAMPWNIGSGNNFAVKRDWLELIGGNNERLGPGSPGQGGVDMDLFYRLLRAGARIRYEPDVLVYHARTNKAGRIARRIPYGYGMGACCMLWLRQRDLHAWRVIISWLLMRARRLARGLWQRHWQLAYEEVLILLGTLGGFVHGLQGAGSENQR